MNVGFKKAVSDFIGWESLKSAACHLAHGERWQFIRRVCEDIKAYHCPVCDKERWTRL